MITQFLNSLSDYITSHIRTYVPIAVGAALAYAETKWKIVLPDDATVGLVIGLVAVVQGVYYALVRALAARWPIFGNLLVVNQQPQYSDH